MLHEPLVNLSHVFRLSPNIGSTPPPPRTPTPDMFSCQTLKVLWTKRNLNDF